MAFSPGIYTTNTHALNQELGTGFGSTSASLNYTDGYLNGASNIVKSAKELISTI